MASKKKVVEVEKKGRAPRYYGMIKPKKGAKMSFLSVQNKNGWSLGLALGGKTLWFRNLRFTSIDEVKRVTEGGVNTVFAHLKGQE